jgi:hypothetical protein
MIGDKTFGVIVVVFVLFLLSLLVSVVMYTEYHRNPDYAGSEIFAQGYMQKSTDCYGITTVKIGDRVVNGGLSIPCSGGWMGVKASDLCSDREYTVYEKSFWVLGSAYTIK